MIERFGRPLQSLRWKLTLSYTIVTVATVAIMLTIIGAGSWFIISNSNLIQIALISIMKGFVVPPVITYLDKPEPDTQGLVKWLEAAATSDGFAFQSPNYSNLKISFGDAQNTTTLLILDNELNYLAGLPEPDQETIDRLFSEGGRILQAAHLGKEDPELISQMSPDRILTIALPARTETGEPLGIVVLMFSHPARALFIQVFSIIGKSILAITLTAGIIGAVIGYLIAHSQIRRLNNITNTADDWSHGDFSKFIHDGSVDELGQLAAHLNQMAVQLQNLLLTRQELAALEERNRLARDLHDSVKQKLFATSMQLGAARASLDQDLKGSREHIAEAQQLTHQSQMELEALIRELRPIDLKVGGLTKALKEYALIWSHQNSIPVTIQGLVECDLPSEVEQTLFRVTQEALANIAKHSQASNVEIELIREKDDIILMICDNGIGFDILTAEGRGIGLPSMHERMANLDGDLILKSAPGEGTQVVARCTVSKGVPD